MNLRKNSMNYLTYLSQVNKELSSTIHDGIQRGEQISPLLFLSNDTIGITMELSQFLSELQETLQLPQTCIYKLEDDGESLKIAALRELVTKSHMGSHYAAQVFVIENISRLTLAWANSLLKFLEEPWVWNIVILTNTSQSWVLDTILSRVRSIFLQDQKRVQYDEEVITMLEIYIEKKDPKILSHYFQKQSTKQDGLTFLYSLLEYTQRTPWSITLWEDIHDDINTLWNNSLNAKYLIDRYLVQLWRK